MAPRYENRAPGDRGPIPRGGQPPPPPPSNEPRTIHPHPTAGQAPSLTNGSNFGLSGPTSRRSRTDGETSLSTVSNSFVRIRFNDFISCVRHVRENPNVIDQDVAPLRRLADQAFQTGDDDLAKRCLERTLMINFCKGIPSHQRIPYLSDIAGRGPNYMSFKKTYEEFERETRRALPSPPPQESRPPNQPITAQLGEMRLGPNQGSRPLPQRHPAGGTGQRRDTVSGTVTSRESLTADYQVKPSPETFFKVGKVFKAWWHSPSGADVHGRVNRSDALIGKFNEPIYSTFRWMMVVKQKPGYCICCPISTYGGFGLAKKNFQPSEIKAHAIVYTHHTSPEMLHNEPQMSKKPIPVSLIPSFKSIAGTSRIHFGKLQTVDYNVKVSEIGDVPQKYHYLIHEYVEQEFKSIYNN